MGCVMGAHLGPCWPVRGAGGWVPLSGCHALGPKQRQPGPGACVSDTIQVTVRDCRLLGGDMSPYTDQLID